jgi:hypothetical protein
MCRQLVNAHVYQDLFESSALKLDTLKAFLNKCQAKKLMQTNLSYALYKNYDIL